ncbi:leucyl aminopeptidase [Candidatus Saganbacteria bacterium]|nr:leucyl aminopeptidase [Candidatus Saganbacteria bacterium]
MIIKAGNIFGSKIACDMLIVLSYEGQKPAYDAFLRNESFSGKIDEAVIINTQGKIPAIRICFVGLGKQKDVTLDLIRSAAAIGSRHAVKAKAKHIALDPVESVFPLAQAAQALTEGLILASYKFAGYHKKHEDSFKPSHATILVSNKNQLKDAIEGIRIGKAGADAENRARDLVNAPSNVVTPEYLAQYAKTLAKRSKLKIDILDPKKEGMECIWGVAKGSKFPPKVVVINYKGSSSKGQEIALIGKGITFDSGGISLKPSSKMWEMKTDMAGAAAVIEAMGVIAELKIKKNIIAVIPIAENMPDGGALKPGDVIGSLDGTTVEIISTDAEGRLILADAITYVKKLGAVKIFDCATLTGGCVTALGDVASGLLGNNQELIDEILEAADRSGQKMWHLPLYKEYEEYLKSSVSDIKNCMDRGMASPSTGATFLHKFVGDTPWVHLDIAGTAYMHKTRGCYSEGATGVPLRTIIEWLRS